MSILRALHIDITTLAVDAIVNAANQTLLGGGGVDGAIHRAAGPGLLAECLRLPQLRPGVRCPTGEARVTGGHALKAPWVIHTAGPIWQGGNQGEAELLAACYRNVFRLAREKHLRSVALPAISCGVYGYPADVAIAIAVRTSRAMLAQAGTVGEVIFACFSETMLAVYEAELAQGVA